VVQKLPFSVVLFNRFLHLCRYN